MPHIVKYRYKFYKVKECCKDIRHPRDGKTVSICNFTIFRYGNSIIRFKAPYSSEYYSEVKEWDNGYLVVMAKYEHSDENEEEYIDLVPILHKLYISPEEFLEPIKEVIIDYD